MGQDRNHIRGDSLEHPFVFTENGSPVDLTGVVARFTIKRQDQLYQGDDDEVVVQKVLENVDDPETGILYLAIANTELAVRPGIYFYDLQVTRPNGSVKSSPSGRFIITGDVTEEF